MTAVQPDEDLWVFGYGSLIWKQNFPFAERHIGYITGWRRVFYQGSTDHRGTIERPGRVVTLIPHQNPNARCYGIAFRITAEMKEAALQSLDLRERCGYGVHYKDVNCVYNGQILPNCVVYVATEDNEEYLGYDTDENIARHILSCSGMSGPNIDYLIHLVEGLEHIGVVESEDPELGEDAHVFAIARAVRRLAPVTHIFIHTDLFAAANHCAPFNRRAHVPGINTAPFPYRELIPSTLIATVHREIRRVNNHPLCVLVENNNNNNHDGSSSHGSKLNGFCITVSSYTISKNLAVLEDIFSNNTGCVQVKHGMACAKRKEGCAEEFMCHYFTMKDTKTTEECTGDEEEYKHSLRSSLHHCGVSF